MLFDLPLEFARVFIDAARGVLLVRRHRVADETGDRERPQPVETFRQVTGSLAKKDGRCKDAEGFRANLSCAGVPPFNTETGRDNRLVLGIGEELILQRGFEVLETALVLFVATIEVRPGLLEGMPRLSRMRFENSTETSVSPSAGRSPFLNQSAVGNESSSATKGSSLVIVAGKKRLPAKP
jgi:hypothetical protein